GNGGVTPPVPDTRAVAVALEGDGKVVMLGQTQSGYELLRYNANGSLDITFGDPGKIDTTFGDRTSVIELAVLIEGRIVVGGGHFSDQHRFLDVARFDADGTPDSTFGTGGVAEVTLGADPDAPFDALTADMDVAGGGVVVVAGPLGNAIAVVRLNAD